MTTTFFTILVFLAWVALKIKKELPNYTGSEDYQIYYQGELDRWDSIIEEIEKQ